MAAPRKTNSRRAALSYDQLRRLTKEAGLLWPDLLVKDYQGIGQDFVFTSDELDALEVRIIANEDAIEDLTTRVEDLEYRVFKIITASDPLTAGPFETIICTNTSSIDIALSPEPLEGDEVNIKRTDAEVIVIGSIDGYINRTINVKNYSMHLVFDGAQWREI